MSILSSVREMMGCFSAKEKASSLSAILGALSELDRRVTRLLEERILLASVVLGTIDPDSEEGKVVRALAAEILSKGEARVPGRSGRAFTGAPPKDAWVTATSWSSTRT